MKLKIFIWLILFTGVCSFSASLYDKLFVIPAGWPQPIYDFKENPLSPEKVELGKQLFYDPLLSRDNTISCASCHLPQTAFTHTDHTLSHGIDNRIGTRNSPALMNLAWQTNFMWDGSIHHLDVQALAPITNHDEMDESLENVVLKLKASENYPALFFKAFSDSSITGQYVLQSISQFMLTLVSANSKYDQVMKNEASFNDFEAKGYTLFQKHCNSCHSEPLFTNGGFENNGLPADTSLNDEGRMIVTKDKLDSRKFKVPTLRNIEVSYPYMHDGRFNSLQMVLFHYTNGIEKSATLSPKLKRSISLNEEDKRYVIAFLKTLTDEAFLNNKKFQFN